MLRRIRLAALFAAVVTTACGTLDAPRGATVQGREINALWAVFFWAAVAVAAIVYGLILWSAVRYRRRPGATPPQVRSNVPVEVVYTVLPVVTVAVLFVLTFRTETSVEEIVVRPAATIHVEAFDWSWRFDYEGEDVSVFGTPEDPPQMVVPAGERVNVVLTSADVIHAFYVPEFLFKRDAIPGRTTRFDLTIDEPGVYRGQCAEFCGLDHTRMRFTVRAVPPDEFDAWLDQARAAETP